VATTSGPVNYDPPGPAFPCDSDGYYIWGRQVGKVDLLTGEVVRIRDLIGPGSELNALGYNVLDGYLYAIAISTQRRSLVRIAANGASTIVADLPTTLTDLRAGDITEFGRYYVFTTTANTQWLEIDVDPTSADYGRILSSGSASFGNLPVNCIRDIAYVPNTARFYTVASFEPAFSALVSFDPYTNAWSIIEPYGNVAGNNVWPAMYAADDGYVYGSVEVTGEIFSFDISGGRPTRLTAGPRENWVDGARCFAGGPIMAMYAIPPSPRV
jgi:hypothetical protein